MTTDHLDDDALSALLDGEATPEEAAHAGECEACTVRAAELRAAARAIAHAVAPVDPARRDAAIAAALGARVVSLDARRRRPPAWALARSPPPSSPPCSSRP